MPSSSGEIKLPCKRSTVAAKVGNVAFMYLPYSSTLSFEEFREHCRERFKGRDDWTYVKDQSKFLYPYVYETHDQSEQENILCQHYVHTPRFDECRFEVAPKGSGKRRNRGRNNPTAIVILHRVHLYMFDTRIGFVVFEISLHEWKQREKPREGSPGIDKARIERCEDPLSISAWLHELYNLEGATKKEDGTLFVDLSRANRLRPLDSTDSFGKNLLLLASDYMERIGFEVDSRVDKHYSANAEVSFFPNTVGNKRAGVLIHVQCQDESCLVERCEQRSLPTESPRRDKALARYLGNLEDPNTYPYAPDSDGQPLFYSPEPDAWWCVSQESLSCITYPNMYAATMRGHCDYMRNRFARDIELECQFMYALLLHQKYVYQTWLRQLNEHAWGAGGEDDMSSEATISLGAYRRKLERFDAEFVYSKVSDVIAYQSLYEMTFQMQGLNELRRDVQEPVLRLEKTARRRREEEGQRREAKVNRFINILAIVASVSAIIDIWNVLVDVFGMPKTVGFFLAVTIVAVVIIVVIYKLRNWFTRE